MASERSIAARTGEPTGRRTEKPGVYPRAYGGTPERPAHMDIWVYPRAYGGTCWPSRAPVTADYGLSPRVRGNRVQCPPCASKSRVYPRAYGGTYRNLQLPRQHATVYPRAYGGTP